MKQEIARHVHFVSPFSSLCTSDFQFSDIISAMDAEVAGCMQLSQSLSQTMERLYQEPATTTFNDAGLSKFCEQTDVVWFSRSLFDFYRLRSVPRILRFGPFMKSNRLVLHPQKTNLSQSSPSPKKRDICFKPLPIRVSSIFWITDHLILRPRSCLLCGRSL